jgi:hypothetical protein
VTSYIGPVDGEANERGRRVEIQTSVESDGNDHAITLAIMDAETGDAIASAWLGTSEAAELIAALKTDRESLAKL